MTQTRRSAPVRYALILLASAVLSACVTTAPSEIAEDASAIRAERVAGIAQAAVDKQLAPGVLTMIRDAQGVIHTDIRGLSDVEEGLLLRQDSLFRMYSMTKPVTSVLAMTLVEDGVLSLDDPVSKWIPGFADAAVYADGTRPEDLKPWPWTAPSSSVT